MKLNDLRNHYISNGIKQKEEREKEKDWTE